MVSHLPLCKAEKRAWEQVTVGKIEIFIEWIVSRIGSKSPFQAPRQ